MESIKVLGAGCTSCKVLADNVKDAIDALKLDVEFEYITDIQKILEYGVMMTPAVLIDGQVKSTGKVLSVKEIMSIINSK